MKIGRFEEITARMGPLLGKLQNSPVYRGETLRNLPTQGVYVFYENGRPMYVGRTYKQSIRKRVRQHTIPSSGHNQAAFAFQLLQEMLGVPTGHGAPFTRRELAENNASKFREQKQRVRDMEVRAVEITDSVTQAVFEIYAALALKTPYNSFDTS